MKLHIVAFLLLLSVVFGISINSKSQYLDTFCEKLVKSKYIYHEQDLETFEDESPNFKDEIVHTIITSTEQLYYRYHSDKIYPIGRTYTWLSDRQYQTDEDIRQNLAILPEWNTLDYLTIFKVPAGIEMGIGIVGPQSSGDQEYPGGGYQALVNSKYLSTDFIVSTTARHE